MVSVGEIYPEKGREAAFFAKQWLESTTKCDLPWDAYTTPQMVRLPDVVGVHDGYDLAGLLTGSKSPLYVESKGVSDAGHQSTQYLAYLAHSYSATKRMLNEGNDKRCEFMWITSHPFGPLSRWSTNCSPERIEEATRLHPEKLGDETFDLDVAKMLSGRLWLIVLSSRHHELMMSRKHLGRIRMLTTLGRRDASFS